MRKIFPPFFFPPPGKKKKIGRAAGPATSLKSKEAKEGKEKRGEGRKERKEKRGKERKEKKEGEKEEAKGGRERVLIILNLDRSVLLPSRKNMVNNISVHQVNNNQVLMKLPPARFRLQHCC